MAQFLFSPIGICKCRVSFLRRSSGRRSCSVQKEDRVAVSTFAPLVCLLVEVKRIERILSLSTYGVSGVRRSRSYMRYMKSNENLFT